MSSGFVSGGTIENPAERDDAWVKAQEELAAARARKDELAQQNDGKSLFEVLQANKAAKQDAFEEAAKFKNQYRALDDDEAAYLDSVLEEKRKKEAQVQKETLEQLDVFRKQQEEAERKALEEANAGSPPVDAAAAQWMAGGRKRKKSEKDGGLLKGVKLRKASSSAETTAEAKKAMSNEGDGQPTEASVLSAAPSTAPETQPAKSPDDKSTKPPKASTAAATKPQPTLSLSLGYASSDEDE